MAMQPAPQPRWMRWVDSRLPIFGSMAHFNAYPTPKNLNYWSAELARATAAATSGAAPVVLSEAKFTATPPCRWRS